MQAAKGILRGALRRAIIIVPLGAVAITLLVAAVVCDRGTSSAPAEPTASATPQQPPAPPPTPTPETTTVSPINGALIPSAEFAALQQRPPLAVMIENSTDARPQFGLQRADLVYEAVAEGGITRFMAIYWRSDAEKIAYVRSARIYYMHWAAELGAVYVHWGQVEDPGPVDVWPVLSRLNIRDLNGMFQGEQVGYRDLSRYAPHNVYTNSNLLWGTARAYGFAGPPTLEPWKFKDDTPQRPADRAAPAVNLSFDSPGSDYAVRWEYDAAANSYLRVMGGVPHTDAGTGERLAARNVAVQFAVLRPSGVKAYNIIDTVGSGTAVVFQDGVAIAGSWRKDGDTGRTRFYDSAGNEISFNRGTTWIEVVPAGSAVEY